MSSRRLGGIFVALAAALALPPAAAAQPPSPPVTETVAEVRVHGNHSIPDAEMLALVGVALGEVVTPNLIETVTERLEASGRFATVEVRKRYRSLTATDRVALVIVVREEPAASVRNDLLRALTRLAGQPMFLPVLDYEEGYGLTYGARFSLLDVAGEGSRMSVPATWGGERGVGIELEAPLPGRVVDRLLAGGSRTRRQHPALGLVDDRTRVRVGADRRFSSGVRFHAALTRDEVRFGSGVDRLMRTEVGVDYRPAAATSFPRNTAALAASVERIAVDGGAGPVLRPRLDAQAFVGVTGQSVVAARLLYEGASGPLPLFEQPLLGGGATLRGWPVGTRMGDRLLAGSLELRVPVTSPLSVGSAGLRFFYDRAAVWNAGQSLRGAEFLDGAGVGVFFAPQFFQVHVDVAHDLVGSVRVHVGAGIQF